MSSKVIQTFFHLSPNSIIHLLQSSKSHISIRAYTKKKGGSLECRQAHLLPIHNIPRPHLISKEPREVLRSRLELEPFLMFPSLVLSVEVAMPVLPLVVVLVFEEWVDRAAVD